MANELQLRLSENERKRIGDRIYEDFMGARADHQVRIQKFRRIYRMWRGIEGGATAEDGAEFQIPMLKWFTFGAWSRNMQALLGDDAEVVAIPTAPTEEAVASKAGDYMTWRFFEYMQATNPLAVWVFRTILFGRGHVEIKYAQDYFWQRNRAGADPKSDKEVLCYDGPKIRPLWPSEVILPAQDDIYEDGEFEWKIIRRRVTPQQLLDGERRGRYQGVRENWQTIIDYAHMRQERDEWWDDERNDSDVAEGVEHTSLLGNRNSLDLWEWYGKWRRLKGRQEGRIDNMDRREERETELLVKYVPRAQLVLGVQDLADIYPRMRRRDPIRSIGLVKDGSYWGPGLGELLEEIQREGTINYNLFRRAGMLAVGPVIFYRPGAGFDPDTFEYKPGTAIPTEDPSSVQAVTFKGDLSYPLQMGQQLKAVGELVTGVSDTTNGQSIDRPNAPRTASGQAMLIQEGNVRASLDMTMLREDISGALGWVWELDREFGDPEVYFRVTEEDSGGLYDVDKGFGLMTSEEREHDYGFDLKFATSYWSRESKKQAIIALYQLSVQNPVLAQNPHALWALLNKVWEAFGEHGFREIVPEPAIQDAPHRPVEEWEMALEGDPDLHVNPLDDDRAHIQDHMKRLEVEESEPPERKDPRAIAIMQAHIEQHIVQMRHKQLLQAAFQGAMQQLQGQQGGAQLGPAQPMPPQFTGPPPQPFPGGGAAGGPVGQAAQIAGPAGVGAP